MHHSVHSRSPDLRLQARSLSSDFPDAFTATSISAAFSDLESGHSLFVVHSLEFFSSALSSRFPLIPRDALFHFLNHIEHPQSPDIQKLSLRCVAQFLEQGDADFSPIFTAPFLGFLLATLSSGDPHLVNLSLRFLSLAYSECEDARAFFDSSALFPQLAALPGLLALEVGDLVCTAIRKSLMATGDATVLTASLCALLPALLASPRTPRTRSAASKR